MKKFLSTLVQCIWLLCALPAFANQTIGLPADSGQGNQTPFGGFSGRYQQVYTSGAFSGPITITALQFFNTQANSGATSLPSGNWTIALSTTSANWNTLSTNFAANIGGNNTVVFTGNLSQPWNFGNTLTINLTTPFAYFPAKGNLLMDVNVSGVTMSGPAVFFDTSGYNGGLKNGSTIIGHVDTDGGVQSGYGLVTGFVGPATGQCIFDPTTNQCMVQGGTFCASGNGVGTCGTGENACWCYLPNYSLTLSTLTPRVADPGQTATGLVTITPAPGASGFIGSVQLSALACPPALSCSFSPNPVASTGAVATSTLIVATTSSTASQDYTFKVTGDIASPNSGPSNGPQSVTLSVTGTVIGTTGGGSVALLTFLALLALWCMSHLWSRKRMPRP